VASTEVLKLFSCFLVIAYQKGGLYGLLKNINEEIIEQPAELWKLAVPSLVYTIQNNLLFFALSNLNAATFQVGYQLKLLTTAIFSVVMLGKSISQLQWLSLVILAVGVAIAQTSAQHEAKKNDNGNKNSIVGFIAVVIAACLSGFAGVYFEKILKNSHTTLWMRNIQMSLSGIVISLICIGLNDQDWKVVSEHGFFYGYTYIVWGVIFLQAVGGLLVAVVVKYADNILKGR
jgi:UDP-galactose transporter